MENFYFIKEAKSVNDFDEIVCNHDGTDIAIGHFLKIYWYKNNLSFYNFEIFLNQHKDFVVSLCTDELLLSLYKQTICCIAHLRNIKIDSFPEDSKIVQELFVSHPSDFDKKSDLLKNQINCFYQNSEQYGKGINLPRLTFLINTLKERKLDDQVKMNVQDIHKLFTAQELFSFQDGKSIEFFLNIPVHGNNLSLLDHYLDSFNQFIEINKGHIHSINFFSIRFFLNDFALMWEILNKNKDENFKVITKKYLDICSSFLADYPRLISNKHNHFPKDLIKFKKQKTAFGYSIFESNKPTSEIKFKNIDTKTIILDILPISQYHRDTYEKVFEYKYIKSTLENNFKKLNVGVISIYGDSLYLTFFNQHKLKEPLFNQTIQDFMNFMLTEKLNPKRDFSKEFNILIDKALMQNELLNSDTSIQPPKTKVKKF